MLSDIADPHERSRSPPPVRAKETPDASSVRFPRVELAFMFDTKFAIVLREDLAVWQKLNVTAFLTSGIIAEKPGIIGEVYRDADGNVYNALSIQPVIVLSADEKTMGTIHRRALEREVKTSLYVEEMFSTGHDAANREVFARFGPDDARVVGIALHADKKIADKITKGAKMHP
jgi:hypothetical protein